MDNIKNFHNVSELTTKNINTSTVDVVSFHLFSYHNIDISPEKFQNYLIIEWNNSQYKKRLVLSIDSYREPIRGGRVLGLIAIAALGFFFLPGLIGVSPLMGALIGAALGWRLFGFSNQGKQRQEIKQEKVVSTPGFDSAPQPPQIGSVIPLAFTNKVVNPNGGIRLLGNVINSYIKTEKNTQTLYQLSSLGLGKFGRVDPSGLLIDSQPRDNFLISEIDTQYTLGEENQTRFIEFPFYSQAISPQNQSSLGASFRANIVNNSINSNTFETTSDDFDIFSPSDNYILDDKEFKVNNKDKNSLKIFTTNSNLTQGNRKIFSLNKVKYTTLKRCSRIDLNLAFDIWARDSDNNLVNYAAVFKLFIDNQFIGSFYEVRKKEGTIRRALTLQNLPLTSHKIELIPYSQNVTGIIYRLDDSGSFRTINTGIFISGKEVLLTIESSINNQISLVDINNFLDNNNKPQTSSDRGANGKLSSVNEIVYPSDIGQSSMINYRNLVINRTICQASDRIQNSPSFSHDVPEAIVYRNHLAAGKASFGSFNNTLIGNGIDFSDCQVGHVLRNITRQSESIITSINGFQITTQFSLNFVEGDDFLVYFESAVNYFPDVFVFTLISKLGGLGNIITERFIDYPSICRSRKSCKTNNFYWDGVIDNQIGWDNWVSLESLGSLLFPSKFAGNFGLLPEVYEQPKDIYTSARILPGSFSQASPNSQKINTVQLTYQYDEDDVKKDKTLTCMTGDAYFSRESISSQALKYTSITNEEQAKKVAARFLKSRIIQNKVVTFDTGLSGFSNREGDLIIVQFALTENQAEISATVRSVGNLSSGSQQIVLSRNIPNFINPINQKVSIYHRESGTVQTERNFSIINGNTLLVSGLTEVIKPDRESWLGDIIIITSDISERIYRISSLKPNDYSVTVTCVNWEEGILDSNDLFFIN